VLGGGTQQGSWSDALVQLVALGLLFAVLLSFLAEPSPIRDPIPILLTIGVVALPVLQLIPLPPILWTNLPGREAFVSAFASADIALPWLPVSLDPGRTFRSLLALLPAVAVFLATLRLDYPARQSLSLLYIALGILSVSLGLAQLAQGPTSPLRFFPITNAADSVGFFANRNHYAALLYSLIPLVAAWVVALVYDKRTGRLFWLVAFTLVFATLMLGLGMARSRAGIMLAVLAGAGSLGLAATSGRRFARQGTIIIAAAWFIGVILIVQYALFGVLARFDSDILVDYRLVIAATTVEVAAKFQPLGSGLGTFEAIYQMFEPNTALLTSYINHAHNDWLELWLEGGWGAVLLLLVFLFWFVRQSLRVWRADQSKHQLIDRALARAATISISLVLLHSVVDYPLRTTAITTFLGWSCALLLSPHPLAGANRRPEPPAARKASGNGPIARWVSRRQRGRASAWQR